MDAPRDWQADGGETGAADAKRRYVEKRGAIGAAEVEWETSSRYRLKMNRIEALARLERCARAVRSRGATSIFLFGSAARDEARPDSDIDLFIDYDPEKKFSLIDLVGIKLLLEGELGVRVDVTTRDSLHPMLRKDIEASAVRVF